MFEVAGIFESLQTSGINSGVPSVIVKFSTPTYQSEKGNPDSLDNLNAISQAIKQSHLYHIVFKGYEPLSDRINLSALIQALRNSSPKYTFEIETSGELRPLSIHAPLIYIVSPDINNDLINETILREYRSIGASFRFYTNFYDNFDKIDELIKTCKILPQYVYIVTSETTIENVLNRSSHLVNNCLRRGYNLSIPLDILLGLQG